MPRAKTSGTNSIFRDLPSVDAVLRTPTGRSVASEAGERHAASLTREVIAMLRDEMEAGSHHEAQPEELLHLSEARLEAAYQALELKRVHRVINATGVVIHTNLGRAPLSDAARRAVADAAGPCTVEYDLASGRRGRRGVMAEELLRELTGAESVLIVNNCAAAAFFVLMVFAAGGEVIISRGELVEIGGDFRVPDVLAQSGATLREVGTTNRTKLSDYERAVTGKTRVILRVHPSNYRIVGFTAAPSIEELAGLAHKHKLLFYEDIGSGALSELSAVGLADEPVVGVSLTSGVGIVTFSGDKLLGGPQAGIIAGRSEYVDRLRKHPLYRALRVDKLTYAALEATLQAYRRGTAADEVPVQRMLSISEHDLRQRAAMFLERLRGLTPANSGLGFELIEGESAVGGGAAPSARLKTSLIAVTHVTRTAPQLEMTLRQGSPPVVARIVDGRVVLDLRTVTEVEENDLAAAIASLS